MDGSFLERVPGAYGDGEVLIHGIRTGVETPFVVVLFHGVHGCASLQRGNKYAILSEMLSSGGVDVCVVETSRSRRDREIFGEDRNAWALAAFRGKTYAMDLYDECSALSRIKEIFPGRSICLWGFSLGGLHSVMIAGGGFETVLQRAELDVPDIDLSAIRGLVISGSGDTLCTVRKEMLDLPILDTLESRESLLRSAGNISVEWATFFYGERDNTFREVSCRNLFRAVPLPPEKKSFIVVKGSDHAFRMLNDVPSTAPLREMTEATLPLLALSPRPAGSLADKP